MPCSFMHIHPVTCIIHRFSLVLILNNKFLHTLFRHSNSPRYQCHPSLFIGLYTYIITFSTRYSVMHIHPVGGTWEGLLTNHYPTFICTSPPSEGLGEAAPFWCLLLSFVNLFPFCLLIYALLDSKRCPFAM